MQHALLSAVPCACGCIGSSSLSLAVASLSESHHRRLIDYWASLSSSTKYPFLAEQENLVEMSSYLWRKYADYVHTKWERMILWNMVEPYTRPKSFTPLVTIYTAAFYTGVIGAAITEQLYKEKYWEDHPGHQVPLMKPKFYGGPWKVERGEVPASLPQPQ